MRLYEQGATEGKSQGRQGTRREAGNLEAEGPSQFNCNWSLDGLRLSAHSKTGHGAFRLPAADVWSLEHMW